MLMTHRFRIGKDVQWSSLRRGLDGWKFVNLKVLCDTTLSSLASSPERRRLKADSLSSHLSSHLPILSEHGCCFQFGSHNIQGAGKLMNEMNYCERTVF